MDKKSLFFVISLTISFWAVNFYFDSISQGKRVAYVEQQQAAAESEWEDIQKELLSFPKAPDYTVVNTYLDDQTTPFSYAFSSENALIPLSFAPPLPREISDGKVLFELRGEKNAFGLYTNTTDPLKVFSLPTFGQSKLWILTLNSQGEPKLYPASYTDGRLTIYQNRLAELAKLLGKEDSYERISKGLVLSPQKDTLVPSAYFDASAKELLSLKTAFPGIVATTSPVSEQKSEYAVLENPYLQLVFSTTGGSLVEINLPFETATDTKSAVKPVEFDKMIEEDSPRNGHFPLHNISGVDSKDGGYYPLIRRDLIRRDGPSIRIAPKYYALNIVSDYPDFGEQRYKIANKTKDSITFIYSDTFRTITKTFTLSPEGAPYCFELNIAVEGDTRGLWLTTGVPEIELSSGVPVYAFKYRITRNGKPDVQNVTLPQTGQTSLTVSPDWISNSNAFFGVILDPLGDHSNGYRVERVDGTTVPSRLTLFSANNSSLTEEKLPGYIGYLPLNGKAKEFSFRIFAGPLSTPILKQIDQTYSNKETGYNPDYQSTQNFHGWFAFISEPFSKFLYFLLNLFYTFTHSWGFSIILLTVALKVMLYPLNAWSAKSMAKTSQINPKLQQLQKKYKNEPKKLQIEIMNLYKEEGANPFSGCFPMLIQIPFLMGMFDLLKSSFQLRGAPFIPGWIDNLAAPDILFSWGFPIPFIGSDFHLLPILLGLITFIQPRIMQPLPADPKEWTEQQRQGRSMGSMMALVFTFMFYNLPAGLNLYWISSSLLGMLQQVWTQKNMKPSVSLPSPQIKKGKKTS